MVLVFGRYDIDYLKRDVRHCAHSNLGMGQDEPNLFLQALSSPTFIHFVRRRRGAARRCSGINRIRCYVTKSIKDVFVADLSFVYSDAYPFDAIRDQSPGMRQEAKRLTIVYFLVVKFHNA